MNRRTSAPILLGTLLAALAAPAPVRAQLPRASAASLGLGDFRTATARGFAALASNPAGLAMPGTPFYSVSILPTRVRGGIGPIGLGDLAEWQGEVVPAEVREEWLTDITADGGQSGGVQAGLTPFALSVGPAAIQVSGLVRGRTMLSPDAAEFLLFGNAGRTGEPRDLALEGSSLDGSAFSMVSAGFAVPLELELGPLPDQRFAVGVSGTYILGHFFAMGRDLGSTLTTEPLALAIQFPVIHTDTGLEDRSGFGGTINGQGFGLNVGAAWQWGPFQAGLTVRNVVNTFRWDMDRLSFRAGQAFFDLDTSGSDFEERPLSAAPPELDELVAEVEELTFAPEVQAGGAWNVLPMLTVTADAMKRIGEGIDVGPDYRAGVGAEYRPLPIVPVRAHAAVITDGFQLGGGAGVHAGPVHIGVGAAAQLGGASDAFLGMFSVSIGGS